MSGYTFIQIEEGGADRVDFSTHHNLMEYLEAHFKLWGTQMEDIRNQSAFAEFGHIIDTPCGWIVRRMGE